jgi:hypothetical protein
MIAIQALTGKMPPSGLMLPSELQEDPNTAEIIWHAQVQVSRGLAEILDKMVRYDFRQRYRDATEVLQAVQLLAKSSTSTLPSGIPGYTPTQPVTSPGYTPTPTQSTTHPSVSPPLPPQPLSVGQQTPSLPPTTQPNQGVKAKPNPVFGSVISNKRRPWVVLLPIIFFLGLGGLVAYVLIPRQWFELVMPNSSPPSTNTGPTPSAVSSLEPGAVIQVSSSPLLLRDDRLPPKNQLLRGIIPSGSVLQVIAKASGEKQTSWLQVVVCTPGSTTSSTGNGSVQPSNDSVQSRIIYRRVEQGEDGWIREADILQKINANSIQTSAQLNKCKAPTS